MSCRCNLGAKTSEKQNCFNCSANESILMSSHNLHGTSKLQYQKWYRTTALHFVTTLLSSYYSYTTSHTFLPPLFLNCISFLCIDVILKWVLSHWIPESWCPQYVEQRNFWGKKTEIMYIFSVMTNRQYSIFHWCSYLQI